MSEKLLVLPDVAERLAIPYSKLRSAVREGKIGSLRNAQGILCIPEDFLVHAEGGYALVDGLEGTMTVLQDSGIPAAEGTLRPLEGEDTFEGRPSDALRQGRKKQVNSYASALAF